MHSRNSDGFYYMESSLVNGNIKNHVKYFFDYKILYQLQENMLQVLYDLLTISEDESYIE